MRVVAQVQHSSLDQSLVVFCVYHLSAPALLCRSIDGISFVCIAGSRFGVSSMVSPAVTPPDMSNFYCLPGGAGGTPMLLAIYMTPVSITCKEAARSLLL